MPAYDPRGGGEVHVDQVLSNISVDWINEQTTVADALFPTVSVAKQSDKYYIFGKEAWAPSMGGDVRAPGSKANEIPGVKVSTDTYFCQEHALQITVTPEERQNADAPLDPDSKATELVTSKIMLGRELAARDIVTDTDNYLSTHVETLSGNDQFSDYDNSSPMDVFRGAMRDFHKVLFTVPNVAIIPWRVMHWLEDHPEFRDRIKYTQAATPSREIVASMLGVDRIVVPGGGYDKANPGQDNDIGYLWGEDIILAYVPGSPGLRQPAFGYEFVWPVHGGPQYADTWFDMDRKADVIRVGRSYDLKLVAKDDDDKSLAGYLIKDAIDANA